LHKYPEDLLLELGRVSGDVVEQVGSTDATSKAVWESYRDFRKTAIGWSRIGLQGFMNARNLPFKYGKG